MNYRILLKMYSSKRRIIRKISLWLVCKLEKGEWNSNTIREIFSKYHKVFVGKYTMGGCFIPGAFDKYTTIGSYCSIARTVRVMNRNHPLDFCSTHAIFFNPSLGKVNKDLLEYKPLEIGSDVWIGHNAIIMPSVEKIGNGSVIAAGAVVNKNVPHYAVVVGNPARVIRYRFSTNVIEQLEKSEWWKKSIEELDLKKMTKPINNISEENIMRL